MHVLQNGLQHAKKDIWTFAQSVFSDQPVWADLAQCFPFVCVFLFCFERVYFSSRSKVNKVLFPNSLHGMDFS